MPDQERDFGRLSESLREAFRHLRVASTSEEEKARLTRRLLAVTRAAKHDVSRAARKLELVLEQLPLIPEPRRQAGDSRPHGGPDRGPDSGRDSLD